MTKGKAGKLYIIAGLLFGIAAVVYFIGRNMPMGFCNLGLAIVFGSLGFKYRKIDQ